MNKENGKGVLFGVLGVMTLIIAILGASLAYFTATARSDKAVQIQAATVTINYKEGTKIEVSDIIPAKQSIAYTASLKTDGKCTDSKGRNICATYDFSITNDGEAPLDLNGTIVNVTEVPEDLTTCNLDPENEEVCAQFKNLSYVVYEVTKTDETEVLTPLLKDENGNAIATRFDTSGSSNQLFADGTSNNLTIDKPNKESGETEVVREFRMLVWLNEAYEGDDVNQAEGTEGNQDFEQGLKYTGTVLIKLANDSDKVTAE